MLSNLILADETNTARPARRWVIEDIVDLEPVGVGLGQLIQLLLEKNVLWVDVGVDEAELSPVGGVFESGANDLQHGGDSSPTSNHPNGAGESWGIHELTFGTFDSDLVTNLQEGDIS
jgi:hypothetical protein